jgi:hypothetical protein
MTSDVRETVAGLSVLVALLIWTTNPIGFPLTVACVAWVAYEADRFDR